MKNEEDEPSGRLRLLKQCQFLVCKPEHSYLEWVLGAALTRNVGIDVAEGEYIYFIDADDYIDKK